MIPNSHTHMNDSGTILENQDTSVIFVTFGGPQGVRIYRFHCSLVAAILPISVQYIRTHAQCIITMKHPIADIPN